METVLNHTFMKPIWKIYKLYVYDFMHGTLNQTWAILLGGVLVLGDIGVLLKIGIGIGYC